MTRFIFNLKVSYLQEESLCLFLLWNEDHEDLSSSQPYPQRLQRDYKVWREQYLKYHRLSSEDSNRKKGPIAIAPTGDRCQDVHIAEKQLLQTFCDWLKGGDFHRLEQHISKKLLERVRHSALSNSASEEAYLDIYLQCDKNLEKLPWEAWAASLIDESMSFNAIRLIRTCETGASKAKNPLPNRSRKARMLAVLAADTTLSVNDDWDTLKSLKSLVFLDRVELLVTDSAKAAFEKLHDKITDDRGWDVLYFAGHSDDTVTTDGLFALSPTVKLTIRDIKDCLSQAYQNGLKLAIFNSCCGLGIARALTQLGIQSVIMREPISDDVATSFIQQICQYFAAGHDISDTVNLARLHFEKNERTSFPSMYSVPSYFCPLGAVPFKLEPYGYQKFIQTWLPSKQETIFTITVTILSLLIPVSDLFSDMRGLTQAIYRNRTQQLSKIEPRVSLIAIDQESINRSESIGIENISTRTIDQRYLSKLFEKLSESRVNVVGVDYILNTRRVGSDELVKNIESLLEQQDTWIVFATYGKQSPTESIVKPKWSLKGDVSFYDWDIALPKDVACRQNCPFAYLLAVTHKLHQTNELEAIVDQEIFPSPRLSLNQGSQETFQVTLTQTLSQPQISAYLKRSFPKSEFSWLGHRIIDFSIPPHQMYDYTPAWELLEAKGSLESANQKVVIIGSGGYEDAGDTFYPPEAIKFWYRNPKPANHQSLNSSKNWLSGAEVQSYMINQLIASHTIIAIHDIWLIGLASISGKIAQVFLLRVKKLRRTQVKAYLPFVIIIVGVLNLQIYVTAKISIPWFLPSLVFLTYVNFLQRK